MSLDIQRVAVIRAGPGGTIATDALAKEDALDAIPTSELNLVKGLHAKSITRNSLTGEARCRRSRHCCSYTRKLTSRDSSVGASQHSSVSILGHPVHEDLHSNITPEIMSYTQELFPNRLSVQALTAYGPIGLFRHHSTIREWIKYIFVRGGYGKLLELGATFERVLKENHKWTVTLRKVPNGCNYWWQDRFDAVAVASGHYNVQRFLMVDGFPEFDIRFPCAILHSKHFRGDQCLQDGYFLSFISQRQD
ncbi:hypothetical protein ACHAO9_007639 [Fusarium lateritium]